MAKGNIPVGRFYATYPSDCTYKLNSRFISFVRRVKGILRSFLSTPYRIFNPFSTLERMAQSDSGPVDRNAPAAYFQIPI